MSAENNKGGNVKDIDFDELDKAVNSLMGSRESKSSTAAPTSSAPESQTPSSSSPTTAPSVTPSSPANTSSAPTPKPQEPVKKAGRFMDVVHPSSDMRSVPTPTIPVREKVSITPPERTGPLVDDVTPVAKPAEQKPAPVIEPPFPDPLDTTSTIAPEEKPEEAPVEEPQDDAKAEEAEELATPELAAALEKPKADEVPNVPLESLFLPDVKVEKRPLGIATAEDQPATNEEAKLETVDATDSEKPADTLVTPDPTLAELGDDVLAIESDASETTSPEKPAEPTAANEQQAETPANTLSTAAIGSIPRQYSVKPSSNDDKHHEALYDSAAHAGSPLQHPEKKKSGWMVVLWVTLLIVVAVGGALALYFFTVLNQ